MNGIDISGWQNGINLAAVPCDFVICKATQGTGFTSSDCVRQVEQALSLGKKVGVYHYIGGQGAVAEMDLFTGFVKRWAGRVMLVLDWEQGENRAWGNLDYLDQCITRVIERTGVVPVVYASASVFPWDLCRKRNCGTWVAQYANNKPTGYQSAPWNEGKYSCAIRQYSSTGRLPGYGGNLDLDKFYGDAAAWDRYANPNGSATPQPAPQPSAPQGSVLDLVCQIIDGNINGDARRAFLGSRYDEVQNFIQHIYDSSPEQLAKEVWAGRYGNDPVRSKVLGIAGKASAVRAVVNGGSAERVYIVKRGDTLSAIAAHVGSTVAELARRNGIANPNIIHPGQRIRY